MARMGSDIYDQAYKFFQQEALDLLQVLESGLLTLRDEFTIPKIHNLMRAAHSIKGGAASVELPGIQKIAHRLEDVLRALYRRDEPIDSDLEEALLMAYDRLRAPLQEQVFTGQYDEAAAWENAEPVFAILESVLADDLGADIELPTSLELGIDVVGEVFSGDVTQSLQRLEAVLEEANPDLIASEIRTIAEVFTGMGELLSLPGFAEIARQTLQAVDLQPDQALLIGQVALENLQVAYQAVMAGDREQGGSPSPALLALAAGKSLQDHADPISAEAGKVDRQALNDLADWFEMAEPDSESVLSEFQAVTDSFSPIAQNVSEYGMDDRPPTLESTGEEDLAEIFADDLATDTWGELLEEYSDLESEAPVNLGTSLEAANSSHGWIVDTPVETREEFGGESPATDEVWQTGETPQEDWSTETWIQSPDEPLDSLDSWATETLLEVPEEVTEPYDRVPETDIHHSPEQAAHWAASEPAIERFRNLMATDALEALSDLPDLTTDILDDRFSDQQQISSPEDETVILPFEHPDEMDGAEASSTTAPVTTVPESIDAANYDDLEDVFGQADITPIDITPVSSPSQPEQFLETPIEQVSSQPIVSPTTAQVTEGTIVKASSSLPDVPSPEKTAIRKTSSSTVELTAQPSVAPTTPTSSYMTDSVRVDASRLERLNNLVGELVTQENGSTLQSQQLQITLTNLQQRFFKFEGISKQFQTWMDQSQKTQVRTHGTAPEKLSPAFAHGLDDQSEAIAPAAYALTDFDALQMDSYNDLYTMMQGSLEEIAQMSELMRDMTLITQQSQQMQRKKQQTLRQVRNDLLWARMMPLGELLQRFPRMVRDLAAKHQKQVRFVQAGMNTLVDKGVLERLYDPLVHLVRNAFDHGTELPAERLAKGKAAEATIEIRAYHRGNQTFIEVRDDGRGIDLDAVRRTAIDRNVLSIEEAENATKEQLYQCLFAPNFSTKTEVSDLSGRGMGMSAVQNQVRTLKGTIAIYSEPGQGTTFVIRLPLTLTIAKLLVFSVNGYLMAIPVDTLLAIISAPQGEIQTIQGHPVYRYQEQFVPIYPTSAFNHHYPLPKATTGKLRPMTLPQNNQIPLLLIGDGNDTIALEVDHILTEQELVIKPFSPVFAPPSYLYGCTILGDGSIVPVVDGSVLIARWQQSPETLSASASSPALPEMGLSDQIPTILVIDDSLTARQTLTQTLQKSGYQTIQAGNGREALTQLQQGTNVQAVFCDVEMPHMNGFEFLTTCRKEYHAAQLPVIMLTSRSSEKHRGIAKLLGANEYLTKPYLEQDLLKTLQSCLKTKDTQAREVSYAIH